MLSRAEGDLYNTKRELWEYYTGKADASVYAQKPFNIKLLRQDVDQYIQSNEEYIRAKQKVDYLNACVDFLDRTIRQITNRTFTIKNAIDWRKFTSGVCVMYLKNYCHITENALSQSQLDYIISFGEKEKLSNVEVFDGEKSEKVRKTKVSRLKEKDLTSKYPLVDIIQDANKKAGWNFQLSGFKVSIFYI